MSKSIVNSQNGLINKEEELGLQQLLARDCIKTKDKKDGFNNIQELFKIMSSSYGDNWNRQYENDSARDVWALMLWEKEKKTILDAIKKSFTKNKRFPPNLVEFLDICDEIELNGNKASKVETIYKRLDRGNT